MNAKPRVITEVFEQVYTSASALLDRTYGDLGVVRETNGFPPEIQPDLDRLNSYEPVESGPGESHDKHPPAYTLALRGPQGSFYSISRTVFAGADHTGRTNPLAHHFVVKTNEMEGHCSPADLLHSLCFLNSIFLSRWDAQPSPRKPPESLSIVDRLESKEIFPSAAWKKLASPDRVAKILGFFAEHMTSSAASSEDAVVFVIPSNLGDDVCQLLSDLLALIPAYAAFTVSARTHVISPPSIAGRYRVMFTYSNTAFLMQERRRQDDHRPVIIDLAGGESVELPFSDYGKEIEQALIKVVSPHKIAHAIKSLVDARSELGAMQDSSGTPFCDFIKLKEYLRSPATITDSDFDALVPLLHNIVQASKAAEEAADSLVRSIISEHVKAQEGNSRWRGLATLAFSASVPAGSRQLAQKAIERYIVQALPIVSKHRFFTGRSAGSIREWLQKWANSKDRVSTILERAAGNPQSQSVECVRVLFHDLKPNAKVSDFSKWVGILNAFEGSTIRDIRKLITEYSVGKAKNREIDPLLLIREIHQTLDKCEGSERNLFLFGLLEASINTDQLGEVVKFIATNRVDSDNFFAFVDQQDSRYSKKIKSEIRRVRTPTDSRKEETQRRTSQRDTPQEKPHDRQNAWRNIETNERPKPSRNNTGTSVRLLNSVCWWGLAVSIGVILLAVLIFMLDLKGWRLTLRLPKGMPSVVQWRGLLAFPLSALFFIIMNWQVRRNTDPTLLGRSIWYLVAALIAIVAGTACTLYTSFHWLRR